MLKGIVDGRSSPSNKANSPIPFSKKAKIPIPFSFRRRCPKGG
jgi:hypothetical protein